eukprot:1151849-Pelagomonas_calceolata.AAC.3
MESFASTMSLEPALRSHRQGSTLSYMGASSNISLLHVAFGWHRLYPSSCPISMVSAPPQHLMLAHPVLCRMWPWRNAILSSFHAVEKSMMFCAAQCHHAYF